MKRLLLSCVTMVLMLASLQVSAQDRTVSGRVTSAEDGSSLPGVSVVLKGTAIGAQTDGDGNYSLSIPSSGGTLTFSFISLKTQSVTVTTQSTVDIVMEADVSTLNEVVVTAGGIMVQRRELGTQASTVNGTDLTQGKGFNVAAGLTGKVPGLLVSAVNGGLNPSYRLVLRGQRSLTGNNQALLVLDGVITPSSLLGNINPNDIEDIQVLNGAGAAALYGSDASNGAIIVTTKKGQAGAPKINLSHTTTFENVNFLPKLQREFGSGTTPDTPPVYTPYENQQYGPRFDGSTVIIGKPLADGSIQEVPYSATDKDARTAFWETGRQNITDFSISSGDDKSTIFLAAQYLDQKSTVPWDEYKRYQVRLNLERKVTNNLIAAVRTSYMANRYDQSSQVSNAYNNVLMSPAHVDITKYKDWETDPFANPNGYYNEYYQNPYFTLANNRSETKNDYLQATVELKWNPIQPLTFTGRVGLNTRNVYTHAYTGKFTYSPYTRIISPSKSNVAGSVSESSAFYDQLTTDLFGEFKPKISDDFTLTFVAGVQTRKNNQKEEGVSGSNLIVSDVYNVGNVTSNLSGYGNIAQASQIGVYGDLRLGFKNWLYLHATGRNDWRSVLAKENRSFFYPAVDVSIILSDAIPLLKDMAWLDNLKLRGGYSQVGQVNINPYALTATFSQAYGYPYSGNGGFSLGDRMVSPSLKPEMTKGFEAGFDLDLNLFDASIGATVYKTNTSNQTIPISVSTATGYSSSLTNVGEVENKGLETYLQATPIKIGDFSLGGRVTYTLNVNKVISLSEGVKELTLGTAGTLASVIAKVGEPYPYLKVAQYNRTPDGKVIVDYMTGVPSVSPTMADVGTTSPPHIVGLTLEARYKGFRLASVAEYRYGHYIMNSVTTAFDFSGAGIRNTWYDRARFVFPNSVYQDPETGAYVENTNITTYTGGADFWTGGQFNTSVGENYTHSAGFWKIREISLSYDFPASWLSSTKVIKAASLSVQGRNLFIWTPKTNLYTDPEYSALGADSNAIGFTSIGLSPPARYVGGTISLTF